MYLPWLKNYNLLIFDEIDSTNSEAIRLARSGLSGNFIIWAKSQSAGRGRYGKTWVSDPGNFFISLLLDDEITISRQPQISFISALALYEAINIIAKQKGGFVDLLFKWPNDLLIKGEKAAGILLESVTISGKNYLIIGIGVNIDTKPNINIPVTTLAENGLEIDNQGHLLNYFMGYFDKYLAEWKKKGFVKFRKNWLKKAYRLNDVITIDDGNNRVSGIFNDIDFAGSIRIKLACGQIFTLSAGEILS